MTSGVRFKVKRLMWKRPKTVRVWPGPGVSGGTVCLISMAFGVGVLDTKLSSRHEFRQNRLFSRTLLNGVNAFLCVSSVFRD